MKPSTHVTSFTTSRPVAVLMVFVAAVVFGYFSYSRLSVRLMPELSYPTITVRTEYPGAGPEEVEQDLSRPIEESLGVLSGLRRVSSVSRAGVSDVILEFSWDTTMSEAVQDTLEKLDLVVLPEDSGPSLILRFDPALDPVLELSLSGPETDSPEAAEAELRRLRRIAELQVKRALEPIRGVAAARVRGGLEEEIHVLLDAGELSRAGLSVTTVIERLEQENINIAGGTIKEGRADYVVRTLNEFRDLEEIADTILISANGQDLRIRDVGRVVSAHRERDMVTRTSGRESVQIDIYKEADANMVDLSKRVRMALGDLDSTIRAPGAARQRPSGPVLDQGLAQQLFDAEGVRLEVVADQSVFIESSIDEVRDTAVFGGLLAVIILFLFLKNLKSTLIVGLSIPVSLLVTFAPLHLLGVSLNIMSLGGLALGIGMLVDSSIVVLESIVSYREDGHDLLTATVRGTQDVRGAVVASTLTTIGVFLPMVFVEGVGGQAFGDLALAVVISLLASLVVALFLLPMLASRQGLNFAATDPVPRLTVSLGAWQSLARDWRALGIVGKTLLAPLLLLRLIIATALELTSKLLLGAVLVPLWLMTTFVIPRLALGFRVLLWAPLWLTDVVLNAARTLYPRLLRWAIGHVGSVMLLLVACFAVTYWSATRLDSELLPEVHRGEFTMELALPVGTPLEETQAILSSVEAATLEDSEHIEALIVTYGYDAESSQRSDEGEHTARFKVLLEPSSNNAEVESLVADRLRSRLAQVPDLEARLVRPVLFSFKTPIEVEIYGDDIARLQEISDRVRFELESMPELTDVESTLRKGALEVQIVFNRDRLRRYQLDVADVAKRVRDEIKGREATRFNRGNRRVPIVVRLEERDRSSVEDAEKLIVDPSGSGKIRLATVADVSLGEGPSEVRRTDGQRVALLRANLAPSASLGAAVEALNTRLRERVDWPSDISFRIAGQNQEWERSRSSLWLALALSIFLVYVIMAAQFESLLYPLIIMFTIPLAFLGTFVTLWGLDLNVSIIVLLGMIMLAGIVVNNAIVLVDYINVLKRRGMSLDDAVANAGAARLRPILMTTATTVLGLLPMAISFGDGAEIRTPLAITVISGLIVSTALTLVIIPTLYVLVDRGIERARRVFRTGSNPRAQSQEPKA